MRDIRLLRIVQEHCAVFSQDVPVYFRADLLRVAAAVEDLKTTGLKYFVYTDFDVETAFSKNQLFGLAIDVGIQYNDRSIIAPIP